MTDHRSSSGFPFNAMDIDWQKAMDAYDSRRFIVGVALRLGQFSPSDLKAKVARLDRDALDAICAKLDEAIDAFSSLIQVLHAIDARLEAARRNLM